MHINQHQNDLTSNYRIWKIPVSAHTRFWIWFKALDGFKKNIFILLHNDKYNSDVLCT